MGLIYPVIDNEGRMITSPEIQSDNKAIFITGNTYSVTAGNEGHYDVSFTETVELFGTCLALVGGNVGDTMDFQIIDIDDILGMGANTILAEYAKDYHVVPGNKRDFVFHFKKDVPSGIYLRTVYHNNGSQDVDVIVNYLTRRQ